MFLLSLHQIGLQVKLFLDLLKLALKDKYFANLFFIVDNSTQALPNTHPSSSLRMGRTKRPLPHVS